MILATRYGFHGKKGLAGAVTGCETDRDRDPRVRFISFPMRSAPMSACAATIRPRSLSARARCLSTPSAAAAADYRALPGRRRLLSSAEGIPQVLQRFCREHDLVFILDEVQSNFGRTGEMFAFETYGLEPDIVVLGKGLGNGVPVAAAVGGPTLRQLDYGEGSDTWSANPLCCAAVLATLDEFSRRR